jgi:dTDP-L-rhamnose 4-epimerase
VVTGEFRMGDVRHITADSTRITDLFGWRVEVEFASGVAELLR